MNDRMKKVCCIPLLGALLDSTRVVAEATTTKHLEELVLSSQLDSTTTAPFATTPVKSWVNRTRASDPISTCGIYLAPSTIPGAGMGMFAGRAFQESEMVSPGDVLIPIVDFYSHNWHIDIEYLVPHSYYWRMLAFTGMADESVDGFALSPGTGAALNCFFPLINVEGADADTKMDGAGLHRSKDPGAGAFTLFHGHSAYATRDIQAAEELFADYGENYFVHNPEVYGQIPIHSSYTSADKLLGSYVHTRDRICREWGPNDARHCQLHDDWYALLQDLRSVWVSRTLNALPEDPNVVDEISKVGTQWTHYKRSIRSVDWLEAHGDCMDHLVPGPSTIEQAGRGAFAQRFIGRDLVISPAPLIHLDRDLMKIYPHFFDQTGELWGDRSAPARHQQLLLNYCFGHQRSEVLLCPYGMVSSLINHSKEKANARVEWNYRDMKHPEWLSQTPEQWLEETHAGLIFNYVATRDIEPGEEVLINYGTEWEEAWKHHVSNWKPPQDADKYMASYDLNQNPDLIVRTVAEGFYRSDQVEVRCMDVFRVWSGLEPSATADAHYCRAVDRFQRNDGELRYTVELYYRHSKRKDSQCYEKLFEVLLDVPRDVFRFSDAPYARDTAQPWSFRQPIGIPDKLLPDAWIARQTPS